MAKKNEIEMTLLERFEKHASSKSFAKKVYNLVESKNFLNMTVQQLMTIPGLGRKGIMLIVEVSCDLNGVK